jgi:hypothetical protein
MTGDSPLVEEVRRRASELSARYDHDLRKYYQHLLEVQAEHASRVVTQIRVVPAEAEPAKAR